MQTDDTRAVEAAANDETETTEMWLTDPEHMLISAMRGESLMNLLPYGAEEIRQAAIRDGLMVEEIETEEQRWAAGVRSYLNRWVDAQARIEEALTSLEPSRRSRNT